MVMFVAYTIKPKQRYAKAYGANLQASTKDMIKICKVIRGKKLKTVKRLLNDLNLKKRSIGGKYYSKAVAEVLNLLNSCEKNADGLALEKERLFVHASASYGSRVNRRRRKAAFGSRMKYTNLEIFLIERGKGLMMPVKPVEQKKENFKGTQKKSERKKSEEGVKK